MTANNTGKQSGWSGGVEHCDFRLSSLNVRGVATNKVKRLSAFEQLKKNGDIGFMQETHSTKETEATWKNNTVVNVIFLMGKATRGSDDFSQKQSRN